MGRLVLDEGGRVLRTNAAAQKLLAAKRGISLKNERLHLSSHNDNQAFKQLLDEVMQAHLKREPGFVRAFRLDQQSGNSLGLLLRPMPQAKTSEGFQQPAIAIFISDPDQRREAPAHILNQLFGFTPAESRLALLLANGLTLDESSAELEVSRNTAKSHLSSIFSKTGVTRQTKLVQLILNSVAPMG
jgi:DNA-binding CsgD family transcriptional regulator